MPVSSTTQHHRPRNAGAVDTGAGYVSSLLTGLTHYYLLGEASGTRSDSVGSVNFSANGAPGNATGINGNGLSLAVASTQYLNATTILVKGADHSLSIWFKPTATGINATQHPIFSCGNTNTDASPMMILGCSMNGNTAKFGVYDNGYAVASTTLVAGTWYHAVYAKAAAGAVTIYLNGSSAITYTQADINNDTNSYIGSGFNSQFDGVIDEVATWSRVLTSAEVTSLYLAGAGSFYPYFV